MYQPGSGTANADASQVGATISSSLGRQGSRPRVHADLVRVDLGDFDVSIHGSILSWLYDLIIDLFKTSIKDAVQSKVEDALGALVDVTLNDLLASFPTTIPIIADTIGLDYSLPKDPSLANQVVMAYSVATFVAEGKPPCTLPHHPLDTSSTSGRDVDLFLDDFTLNSGSWAAYYAGLMEVLIRDSDIPATVPLRLNTTDWQVLVPALYKQFPNQLMTIFVNASSVPLLSVSPDRQLLSGTATLSFTVLPVSAADPPQEVFVLDAVISSTLEIGVADDQTSGARLTLHVDKLAATLQLRSSAIGTFSVLPLQAGVGLLLDAVLLPLINDKGSQGFPLPSLEGVTLLDPTLTPLARSLHVATDIAISPVAAMLMMPVSGDLDHLAKLPVESPNVSWATS